MSPFIIIYLPDKCVIYTFYIAISYYKERQKTVPLNTIDKNLFKNNLKF